MGELYLVVSLAGRHVAIPASQVEAVVELEGVTPAPRTSSHVAGLSALRSRVLTVIDPVSSLNLGRTGIEPLMNAVIIMFEGHPYALLVDAVEDVIENGGEPQPIRASAGSGWERVTIGLVPWEDQLLLLVDAHKLIAGPSLQAA